MLQFKFDEFLQTRLNHALPGVNAQKKMAPHPKNGKPSSTSYTPNNEDYRNSSVLIPFIAWEEELKILLTLRSPDIKHGGQLSFPGGGKEGHENIIATALREAQEEIGLTKKGVEIIGELTPLYVGHSDNMVTPVIAFLRKEQEFTPNPNEVAEILQVPFEDLIHDHNLMREEWDLKGTSYHVPFWDIHRVPLWGATAMIMSELVELYKEFQTEQKK